MTLLSSLPGFSTGGSTPATPTTLNRLDIDRFDVGAGSGWLGNSTYGAVFRTAGGTKNNTFFVARLEYNPPSSSTRHRIYPFSVDGNSGSITLGTAANIWSNSSAAGHSTTSFHTVDGTGCMFAGGHNMYPGYTSHYFGYDVVNVSSSGTISGNTYAATNQDHSNNGNYTCLPTGINSGNMIVSGYNGNTGSVGMFRIVSVTNSTISVGSASDISGAGSSPFEIPMITQPGVYQSGAMVTSLMVYYVGSTYTLRALGADGSWTDHTLPGTSAEGFALQLTDGSVLYYAPGLNLCWKFALRNSKTDLSSTAAHATLITTNWSHVNFIGLGANRFIYNFENSSTALRTAIPLVQVEVSASTGEFTYRKLLELPDLLKVGYTSSYTSMFPIYASSTDNLPSKICFVRQSSQFAQMQVLELPDLT